MLFFSGLAARDRHQRGRGSDRSVHRPAGGRKEALPPETKAEYTSVCGERERASRANNRSEGKAER